MAEQVRNPRFLSAWIFWHFICLVAYVGEEISWIRVESPYIHGFHGISGEISRSVRRYASIIGNKGVGTLPSQFHAVVGNGQAQVVVFGLFLPIYMDNRSFLSARVCFSLILCTFTDVFDL